jgi:hypothetical protein
MPIRSVIKALGGPSYIASQLGLTVPAVSNWSLRDAIPGKHQLAVWRLARAAGVDWTPPAADGLVLGVAPRARRQRPAPVSEAAE